MTSATPLERAEATLVQAIDQYIELITEGDDPCMQEAAFFWAVKGVVALKREITYSGRSDKGEQVFHIAPAIDVAPIEEEPF